MFASMTRSTYCTWLRDRHQAMAPTIGVWSTLSGIARPQFSALPLPLHGRWSESPARIIR